MSRTILPDKRIKQNIKIIDGKLGYFECNNYCNKCKSGNCELIQEVWDEYKKANKQD
jgi:DNA-binding IscR family transcriptional regulator